MMGSFEFIQEQIFQKKTDVDIAFIGSSRILYGLDVPYLQKKLSEKLGRPAEVITLGWFWSGFDQAYFIAHDLLQHRKVTLLVFTDESHAGDNPHRLASHWFRWGDNAKDLAGIPPRFQAAYYFGAIIGMPRNLLSLIRPNCPDLTPAGAAIFEQLWHSPNPMTTRGSLMAELGFNYDLANHLEYTNYAPANGVTSEAVRLYSAETKAQFQFSGPPASPLQLQFARKFAALATAHQTKLVCLHLPEASEMREPVIHEREFWPTAMQSEVVLLGIPPATLFAGLPDDAVRKLFMNDLHFNKNGLEFYTPLITPSLWQLYVEQVKH